MREPRNAMQCRRHKAAGSLLQKKQEDHAKLAKHVGLQLQRGKSFSEDEEDLLIKLHALLGNRWSLIAGRLPGRTDVEVKNHWNSQMRRKLKTMGMDPENRRVTARLSDQRPPRNECDEHRAKHLNNVIYSVDDADRGSDAGSRDQAHVHHPLLPYLNLELTLSMPCMHVADEQQKSL